MFLSCYDGERDRCNRETDFKRRTAPAYRTGAPVWCWSWRTALLPPRIQTLPLFRAEVIKLDKEYDSGEEREAVYGALKHRSGADPNVSAILPART